PLVMNEVALRMLNAGNAAGALALFEQVVVHEPNDPALWFNFAAALRRLDRPNESLEAIERLLVLDPNNLSALIEKGELLEQLCKPRQAAMSFHNALRTVPPGFKPPPWMEAKLAHARKAVDDNNRALE